MSDELALLAAIRDNPDEDTPRLVYADWLDEQGGDANAARAEFIRVQCEYSRIDVGAGPDEAKRSKRLDARAQRLCRGFSAQWVAGFPSGAVKYADFARGFRVSAKFAAAKFSATLAPPWYREPGLEIELSGSAPDVTRLFAKGQLDGVRELEINPTRDAGADAMLAALAASGCAATLRKLGVWSASFTDLGLRALASGNLGQLREVSFMGRFSARGWADFFAKGASTQLEDVTIGHRGPWQTAAENQPGPALAGVLATAPQMASVERLWLSDCGLTDVGLAEILACGWFDKLSRLHLGNDVMGSATDEALGTAKLPALTQLLIGSCHLRDTGVETLANGSLMSQLEQLDVTLNELGPASARAIAVCGRTHKLKELNFGCTEIGDEGVIALMASPHFPTLTSLMLSSLSLTDRGADAVLNAKWLSQLKTLFLSYNSISPNKRAELVQRFGKVLWIAGT